MRVFGDLHRKVPRGRGDHLGAGAVALGGSGVVLLVHAGADVLGGLGIDERLEDRVEQGAHELAVIGGAHRFGQLEQGRLVQGHRVVLLS